MASLEQERRTYDDGRYIFREHESGDQAFILVSGSVEIVRVVDNEIRVLATLGQGEIFGEMALIDDQPRMASARAAGQVTAAIISRDLFKAKLARTDPFIRALLKIFSGWRRISELRHEEGHGFCTGNDCECSRWLRCPWLFLR